MKLGLITGYSGASMGLPMELILEAEKAGFDYQLHRQSHLCAGISGNQSEFHNLAPVAASSRRRAAKTFRGK